MSRRPAGRDPAWPVWARGSDRADALNDAAIRRIGAALAEDAETRALADDLAAAAEAYWHLRRTAAAPADADLGAAIERARDCAEALSVCLARLDAPTRDRLVAVVDRADLTSETARPAAPAETDRAHRHVERLAGRLADFVAAARQAGDALAAVAAHHQPDADRLHAAVADLWAFHRDYLADHPPPAAAAGPFFDLLRAGMDAGGRAPRLDDAALAETIRRALARSGPA